MHAIVSVLSALAFLCQIGVTLASPPNADSLRIYLEAMESAPLDADETALLHDAQGVFEFYREMQYTPVWSKGGALADQLTDLEDAIRRSADHGLHPDFYHLSALQSEALEATPRPDLRLEVLATDAFLTQVQHRSSGVVSPRDLDPDWHLIPPEVDSVKLLVRVAREHLGVRQSLDDLWPKYPEYAALVAHRARILVSGETESIPVPRGPVLRRGSQGERVVLLKHRLLGPGQYTPDFDDVLASAVTEFQRASRLESDGLVGPATLEVLNETRVSWVDRIDANLERWRWLPVQRPVTYVRVNIADFTLAVIADDREILDMSVIVGRPFRQTPVFSAEMRYLVLNPYWNVPYKIAVEDKLPLLQRAAADLAAEGYEARAPGDETYTPVDGIDWSKVTKRGFGLRLRQRPGPFNALGRVKFMLPNEYSVYLHDTPARELFAKQERSFSSGCIRLSDPRALAVWVLQHDGRDEDAMHLDEWLESGQTSALYLHRPVPVFVVYFTAFTDANGDIVFRRDVYRRDEAIVSALRGKR